MLSIFSSADVTGILPVGNGGSPFDEGNGSIFERVQTQDLLLGSNATASAKFAFVNVNSDTPTELLSGVGGSTFLTADGTLATTNNQALTLGTAGTGSIFISPNGATDITALTNGNVGIGTTTPETTFAVTGAPAGEALSIFNYTGGGNQNILVASTSGSEEFAVASNGELSFTGGSGNLNTLQSQATGDQTIKVPDLSGAGFTDTLCFLTIGNCAGAGGGVTHTGGGTPDIAFFDSPNDITGTSAFTWNNALTVSGSNGGAAATIVNQQNSGDIFAASSSGVTQFIIGNSGVLQSTFGSGFLQTIESTASGSMTYELPGYIGSTWQVFV